MKTTKTFQKTKCLYFVCLVFFLTTISITYQGCTHDNKNDDPILTNPYEKATRNLSSLEEIDNCDELLKSLKERTINAMEKIIIDTMENIIENGLFCYYLEMDSGTYGSGSLDKAVPTNQSATSDEASEYSETNNQIEGVDEADFIKNDGSYIYILVKDKFKIIDAWPPESAQTISSYAIEGTPKKLFINENHALIFSSLDNSINPNPVPYPDFYSGNSFYYQECTYGYNCDFTGDGKKLKVTVLDITDRINPVVKREISFSGSFINTRRINNAVHTVILFPELTIEGIAYWPESLDQCWDYDKNAPSKEEIIKAFEELLDKNRALIENSEIADWLPEIQDTHYTSTGPVVYDNVFNCKGFYESQLKSGKSILSLLSFNMTQLGELNLTSILGNAGAVYASSSALYVSSRQQYRQYSPWFYDTTQNIEEASTVHKFNIMNSPADCEYAGSGVVKGKVLNQFSMDEFNGFLRIATTTGHVPSANVHSTLSVLQEESNQLNVVGKIDNIAPKEDIRSVRFDGPRGFIVTFKKTDPLFALNLSNPLHPKIEGELKIPGFSTYMQMMDEDHLLTIGYDADDQGDFAWFQGIMLQIFDISDLSHPTKVADEVIGTRGSSSDAATNHLAFNYYPPKDLLALPMTICEEKYGSSSYGSTMTFSGLLVYDVTTDKGFSEKGRISHMDNGFAEYQYGCYNWWTDSNTVVKRSIVMDNYIYSVALDKIKIQNLDNLGPGQDICVVHLDD